MKLFANIRQKISATRIFVQGAYGAMSGLSICLAAHGALNLARWGVGAALFYAGRAAPSLGLGSSLPLLGAGAAGV